MRPTLVRTFSLLSVLILLAIATVGSALRVPARQKPDAPSNNARSPDSESLLPRHVIPGLHIRELLEEFPRDVVLAALKARDTKPGKGNRRQRSKLSTPTQKHKDNHRKAVQAQGKKTGDRKFLSKPAKDHALPTSKTSRAKGDKTKSAMQKHMDGVRADKNKYKDGARAFGGSKKAAKAAERKDRRKSAKLQKWQAQAAASPGKYKVADGKKVPVPVDKSAKTPKGSTPESRKAKAAQDAKDGVKAKNREKRIADKAATRKARKTQGREGMAKARAGYQASKGTGTVPDRKTQYNTPTGDKFNGKDARQALFNIHKTDEFGKVGYQQKNGKATAERSKHPKEFNNTPNVGREGKPVPGMTGPGVEYGLKHDSKFGYDGASPNPTAARLIAQKNPSGALEVKGVVAHPEARPKGAKDKKYDDHVLVPPTR